MKSKTLYDKLWDAHLVKQHEDGSALMYIDRHIIHEVTSPQAFEGLRLAGRKSLSLMLHSSVRTASVGTWRLGAGCAPDSRLCQR